MADDTASERSRKRFARRQWARRWLAWRHLVAAFLVLVLVVGSAWLVLFSPVLAVDGVETDMAPASLLAAEVVERAAAQPASVVVVVTVAPGGVAQARYVIKRLRARLAELPMVAVRWGPPEGVDQAREQLLTAGATGFAGTLREAREQVLQYRQVRTEPAPSQAA